MIDMSSDKIAAAIDKIAATPGKNDKEALVKAYSAFPQFMRVLKAALEPNITYGIRKMPERPAGAAPGENTFENAPIWQVIDDLAARRLTGISARDEITKWLTFLTPASAELFKRIILKDLRAGFGDSTVNKACGKGTITTYPYMRCSLESDLTAKTSLDTWPWADGVPSQEKADGMFMNVNHEIGGEVTFTSRQGSPFPSDAFEDIIIDIRELFPEGRQQHGEMLVEQDGKILPREISNGIMNHIADGGSFGPGQRPVYMVWDSIPLEFVKPKGKYEKGYKKRLAEIVQAIAPRQTRAVRLIPTKIVRSRKEAMEHAAELLKIGKEGTIVKHPDAIWKDGTSNQQIKQKLEFECDLKIVAIVPGKENTKTAGRAGSLTCETAEGLLRVDVAVKNEKMRDAVDADPASWIGGIMPVRANMLLSPSESNDRYCLFLPRFTQDVLRIDKTEADSLERVGKIEEAAKMGEKLLDLPLPLAEAA